MIFASQAPGSRAADLTVVFDFPQTTTIGVSFTIAAVVVAGSVGEGWFLHTSETAAWWESTGLIGRTVGGIRVRCKQFQVSELPRVITLSLRESNGSDILTYVLAVPIERFCGLFLSQHVSSKARLNVLLYGSHESGRSSFLNACFTLFSKERRVLAVSHTGGSHETAGVLKMERYRLCCIDAASGRLQGHMGSQLCLFDTKCSADPATSAANLAQILKGVDFFKPAKGAAVPMTSKRAKPQPKLTTTMHMHCVAVFLPAAEMAAPTVGPQAVQMREFVATCSKAGIMSIVCLSKADVVDSAFCEDPCHPSPVLAAARAKAAAFFAVAEAQVLLHSASKYLTEWSKHFESDRNTYRVIAECQKIASAHLLRAKAMSEV